MDTFFDTKNNVHLFTTQLHLLNQRRTIQTIFNSLLASLLMNIGFSPIRCYPPSSSKPASHPLNKFGSATATPSSKTKRTDEHPSTPSAVLAILMLLVEKRRCFNACCWDWDTLCLSPADGCGCGVNADDGVCPRPADEHPDERSFWGIWCSKRDLIVMFSLSLSTTATAKLQRNNNRQRSLLIGDWGIGDWGTPPSDQWSDWYLLVP